MTDFLAIASAFAMHAGSRHITFDLTKAQKELISHPVSKVLIMFGMFYISTRSLMWSIILLFVYFLSIHMLLNENHRMNIFSPSWLMAKGFIDRNSQDPSYTELYRKNLEAISR
jgi:hypothetical protein